MTDEKNDTDFYLICCGGPVCVGIIVLLFVYYGDQIEKLFWDHWLIYSVIIIFIIGMMILKYFIKVYNLFCNDKNNAESYLGQIRVAMKKRMDLIEQLVSIVKSYAEFERDTMINISEMRSKINTANFGGLHRIELESRIILGRIIAIAEAYPDLKTNNIVQTLTYSIQNIESEISTYRYAYNQIIKTYNTRIDTIPSNIVAILTKFKKMDYLEYEPEITKIPSTEFYK
jgi:LemA protein